MRVEVEIVRRREEGAAILQDLRIAMAELARRLQLDPQLPARGRSNTFAGPFPSRATLC